MTGGSVAIVEFSNTFNLYGGTISAYINADGGTLNLYGSGLYYTVVAGRTPTYYLYGTLQDGTVLNGLVVNTTGGETTTINVFNAAVPEPSTLLMSTIVLALAAGLACWRDRGQKLRL